MAALCESDHLPTDATEGTPCGRLHDLSVSEVALTASHAPTPAYRLRSAASSASSGKGAVTRMNG
jgi:hypothetical protein